MIDLHNALIAGRMIGGGGGTPPPEPVLIEKTITENGTYNASSDNADGYSSVTVNCRELPVTFLKSIKSLGNSIIFTDIVPSYDWAAHLDLVFGSTLAQSSPTDVFFGLQSSASWFLVSMANNGASYFAGYDWQAYGGHAISNVDYTNPNTVTLRRGDNCSTYGAKAVYLAPSITQGDADYGIAFFGARHGTADDLPRGSIYAYRDITLYGCRIFDGSGVLIHNLLPAQSKATGRGGLYDTITGTFYPSDSRWDDVTKEA